MYVYDQRGVIILGQSISTKAPYAFSKPATMILDYSILNYTHGLITCFLAQELGVCASSTNNPPRGGIYNRENKFFIKLLKSPKGVTYNWEH